MQMTLDTLVKGGIYVPQVKVACAGSYRKYVACRVRGWWDASGRGYLGFQGYWGLISRAFFDR